MRNLPAIVFLSQIILFASCNAPTNNLEDSQSSKKEDASNLTSVKKTKLSDTIFLGFRFGMSLKEAERQTEKLKAKGEKINLSTKGNSLSGSYLLNNGKYSAKSKLTLSFVKNKLSDLQIYIHENDQNFDFTTAKIIQDLADYFATIHGKYSVGEDFDSFDYYYWKDGNRTFRIYQKYYDIGAKRCYNADFNDDSLHSGK